MNEQAAIESVIQMYFDASFAGDGRKMAEVFHEAAHIYGLDKNGTLTDWSLSFFVNLVGSSVSSKSMGLARRETILSLDFTGENTAVARVSLRVRDTLFTDILSFIRLNGKWKIMAKVLSGVPILTG